MNVEHLDGSRLNDLIAQLKSILNIGVITNGSSNLGSIFQKQIGMYE